MIEARLTPVCRFVVSDFVPDGQSRRDDRVARHLNIRCELNVRMGAGTVFRPNGPTELSPGFTLGTDPLLDSSAGLKAAFRSFDEGQESGFQCRATRPSLRGKSGMEPAGLNEPEKGWGC